MDWGLISRLRRAVQERHLAPQTQHLLLCLRAAASIQQLSNAVTEVAAQRGSWDDVAGQLCDVITEASIALDALTDDPAYALQRHLARVGTALPTSTLVCTLQAAAALSPALLQPPRKAAA